MISIEEQASYLSENTIEVIPEGSLLQKLALAKKENRPLIIKLGADPSTPDLHLGHSVVLNKLKQFQQLGHQAIFLIGDFTGMIGDPSGRSKTRPALSEEQIKHNTQTYKEQIFQILDPKQTKIVFNSTWNGSLKFNEVLQLSAHCTVAQILERDDFHKRYQDGNSISLMELLYPLVQAYDSVILKADIELGGSDQKFNLLLGRTLQKAYGIEQQTCLMMPILEGLNGKEKMSKSLNNYVALQDKPENMFGKLMSIPDTLIFQYLQLLTNVPNQQIIHWKKEVQQGKNPKLIKLELASTIVEMYYSKSKSESAKNHFEQVFSQKQLPDTIRQFVVKPQNQLIVNLMVESGLTQSKSEARRLIRSGAVTIINHDGNTINKKKIDDEQSSVTPKTGLIIRAGKRQLIRLEIITE